MKAYAVNTEEKCDALMSELEAQGCEWRRTSKWKID